MGYRCWSSCSMPGKRTAWQWANRISRCTVPDISCRHSRRRLPEEHIETESRVMSSATPDALDAVTVRQIDRQTVGLLASAGAVSDCWWAASQRQAPRCVDERNRQQAMNRPNRILCPWRRHQHGDFGTPEPLERSSSFIGTRAGGLGHRAARGTCARRPTIGCRRHVLADARERLGQPRLDDLDFLRV